MATTDRNPRHLPCHILHDSNLPCVVWFEDAIANYGVPTVVFDLYILVQDLETAAQVLVKSGWNLVLQEKGEIGNAIIDSPQRRLTPPSQYIRKAELPTSHPRTSNFPPPLPDKSLPGPTTTVLLPAADWNFSLAEVGANDTKPLMYTVFPPLAGLVDALIDSLLDFSSGNAMFRNFLANQITYLYRWAPEQQEKMFAEQLRYEHRQYHLDVLSGMSHGTVPFVAHQRKIREASRQGTHVLQECTNKALCSREVEARLLAAMPNPFADMKEDVIIEDGWAIFDNPE
jgi:hypothetical protein